MRFSKLVIDYLGGHPVLRAMVPFAPDFEGMEEAVAACLHRQAEGKAYPRKALVGALKAQYADLDAGNLVRENIEALGEDALCVVTAHQLNLFGGPLYLIHKTVAAIRTAELLNQRNLEQGLPKVVPVFWLGSEDHDFAEVDHFQLFGKTLRWTDVPAEAGRCSTGGMPADGLEAVYAEMEGMLRDDAHAESLLALFKKAYLQGGNFADAQRRLLHALFGRFGLVVLNADVPELKQAFVPVLEREVKNGLAMAHGTTARSILDADWHVQAEPRSLNLFYRAPSDHRLPLRERVDRMVEEASPGQASNGNGQSFVLAESNNQWTMEGALELVRKHPERFSPNVQLRPLYQQSILPSVAFLGGGSEVAYWLPMQEAFHASDVFMPVLLLRQSFWWIDAASAQRMRELDLEAQDMFQEAEALIKAWVHAHETADLSLEEERKALEALYQRIADRAAAVDPSLRGKVEAERAGQQKALDKLEGRLTKASKQKHETQINRLRKLLEKHFPGGGLQERQEGLPALWLRHGAGFIDVLMESTDPTDAQFCIVQEKA